MKPAGVTAVSSATFRAMVYYTLFLIEQFYKNRVPHFCFKLRTINFKFKKGKKKKGKRKLKKLNGKEGKKTIKY